MTHPVKLITTATVLADSHVLLVKYKDMPDHQKGWFLPHDLLNQFEHPADGIARALREQLSLDAGKLSLRHIESFKGRDGTWHLPFHFLAELPARPQIEAGTSIDEARWFGLDAFPRTEEVAHHGWALDTIQAIRAAQQ